MDLFDFSSVELLDRVRMIGKVPCFIPLIGFIHQNWNARISLTYMLDGNSSLGCIVTVSSRQVHFDNDLVICGYHVKLGIPSAL